jgi:hypothetical protein
MYITVTSANGRSYYLAKQRVGLEEYVVIATFTSEPQCRETADAMNKQFDLRKHTQRTKDRT